MPDLFDLDEPDLPQQVPSRPTPDFIDFLNPEQRLAVETTEGPLLVLSGAGTGKTRVLTTRIAYLLATGKATPWQILAVTFTNKASREMKDRLEKMIGLSARSVWLGTFHSIGFKILSRYTAEAGLKPNFIVLNTDDQERLLKKIMQENGVDIKQHNPATLLDIIQRWKDRGLSPTAITPAEDSAFCDNRARGFYQLYQNRLRELNAADFGDLLLLPLELLKNNPTILSYYQSQFRYILVDEYQDTNIAQYLFLRLLAQKSGNLCCVGDDDQSIYSWRGAEVSNILNFQHIYPNATLIRLERNYRSTAHILGAASALISHNLGRLGKTLKVGDTRNETGEKVHITGYWNGGQEAGDIVSKIEHEQTRGTSLSQMAILVRTSAQTRPFEEVLIKQGIPYRIVGGFKFYEREEIRDAVAYLRLILNTTDDLAFMRIVNKPRRGIGDGAIAAIETAAKEHHLSLFDAIAWAELRPSVRRSLDAFTGLINMMRDKLNTLDLGPLAKQLLEDSGYIAMWQTDKSPEAEGRLENISELYNVLDEFETLPEFIEYAALITDADDNPSADQLTVMTLHASKGLEFDSVFLSGWEEGLFPHQKALDENGESGLEEERRLAYVGLTRARYKAFISFASNRKVYGQWQNSLPSRFIDELAPEHTQNDTQVQMGYSTDYDASRFSWQKSSAYDYESSPFATPKPTQPPTPQRSKRIGRRVYHDSFGYGTVIKETPNGLEVHFDDIGIKKVQSKFLSQVS